jgi:cell division protein FtsI (penicillin-binding protein 3)
VLPPDRGARQAPRTPADRSTGPDPRLPGNARVRPAAGRPAPEDGPPRRPARPPRPPRRRRPPRWLTAHRGEPARRVGITLLAITIVLTLFAGRMVQLQGMESGYYKNLANKEKLTTIDLPAERGSILGANGQILAMTVETYTITADPPLIPVGQLASVAAQAAGPLQMTTAQVLYALKHPAPDSPDYVKLKAGVPAGNEITLAALDLPGIYSAGSFAPAYPNGTATADVVGLSHITDPDTGVISGYSGLEYADNKLLTGTTGKEQVEISSTGEQIPLAGTQDSPAVNGASIKTTIIPALQFEAQQACEQEVAKSKAASCSVVIEQPKTGAILAMAQWPNAPGTDVADQYLFAPGSTAKVITAAAAFEHGGKTPMSTYNIPYQIFRGGQYIHDAEWSPGEKYTIAGIIANSSNIGMSQVAESISPQTQYDYLKNFGLGQPTGLGLPGESPSVAYGPDALPPVSNWAADERYTLSFGQGVSVNAVQMASVYATIANGGVRVQPTLVEGTSNAAGQYSAAKASPSKRVIQAKTASELVSILQQVPGVDDEADQRWGEIPGYAVAAKTGTSSEPALKGQKPCPAGNPLCVHGSSYIGMAPGNNPGVVVAVNVQDPQTNTDYFGDEVAGPVFYSVMKFALQTLQIQPQPGLVAPDVRLNAR